MNRITLILIYILLTSVWTHSARAGEPLAELLKAVQTDDSVTAKALLARGMDVDTADPSGNTLLMIAARKGHFDLVKFLLDAKARVRARNGYGESAIMAAALHGHLEVVKVLQAYGSEINHSGWTPLHYAAWGGYNDVCSFLLEKGAEINARSANGSSPIMMAARQGNLETARLLLVKGADLSLSNDSGETALSWAVKSGDTALAELLRKAGAK